MFYSWFNAEVWIVNHLCFSGRWLVIVQLVLQVKRERAGRRLFTLKPESVLIPPPSVRTVGLLFSWSDRRA